MAHRSRLLALIDNPAFRLVALAPAALSIVANFDDIGKIATYVVRHWQPILDSVAAWIQPYLPSNFPLPPRTVATIVMFIPFTIEGIANVVRRRDPTVDPLAVAFTFAASFVLSAIHLGTLDFELSALGMLVFTSFLIALAGLSATYTIAKLGWRQTATLWTLPTPSVAIASVALWLTMLSAIALDRGYFHVGAVVVPPLILSLPAFAPRRVVDVCFLAAGIVAISIAHSAIEAVLLRVS